MAVVKLMDVAKRYGDVSAVEDVNLTIADGEFTVLLGPSGCGKSTTLRMIAGLETISSGTLSIDGVIMNGVPAKDRDIAMVFQSYALYPHMSVRDNLGFGLKRRDVPRPEIVKRVTTVAEMLGLTPLLQRKPHALSGGQRQRVALGRAIVRDPKVFLFDEPLSNLDAALRVNMRAELIKLHQRLGTTMIYVTHDQVEAMTMGTRICIMRAGRVVQIGAPLDVYRRPASTFVASFLGNPPMNLMPARLEASDGRTTVQLGAHRLALDSIPSSTVERFNGRAVTFGIRPEDLSEQPHASEYRSAILPSQVVAVEPLGAETLVVVAIDGVPSEMTARLGRECQLRPRDPVGLSIDLGAVHLFDPETGDVITSSTDHRLN